MSSSKDIPGTDDFVGSACVVSTFFTFVMLEVEVMQANATFIVKTEAEKRPRF